MKYRTLLLAVAVVVLQSCRAREDSYATEDTAVLAAVLRHFCNTETHSPTNGSIVLVADRTPEKSGMIDDNQLVYDLVWQKRELPKDVRKSMRQRNQESVAIPPFTAGLVDVNLTNAIPNTHWPFIQKHPEIKACLNLWLPGYAADGHAAAVRFWYGPLRHSNHSATGTYKLTKRGEKWEIEWAAFVEYP